MCSPVTLIQDQLRPVRPAPIRPNDEIQSGRGANSHRPVAQCSTMGYMASELWWDDEDAEHIRTRSSRYPEAHDIEPAWTIEAASDPHRVSWGSDSRSRAGYTRLIGYSSTAGFVLTVIIDPTDNSGVTAWKTRGADLRNYLEGKEGT